MRELSAAELLEVCELGMPRRPDQRALLLLGAAFPEVAADALAQLTIGQRDTCLLSVRERAFGSRVAAVAACPDCGEQLELTFDISDIRCVSEVAPPALLALDLDEYAVQFRLPSSLDVAASVGDADVRAIRMRLLERCIVGVQRGGESASVSDLPSGAIDRIVARMVEMDPQADVELALACPACHRDWLAPFDIAGFLWTEVRHWASLVVRDVHVLASAYGWREADILALSPWRRQLYLQAVGR